MHVCIFSPPSKCEKILNLTDVKVCSYNVPTPTRNTQTFQIVHNLLDRIYLQFYTNSIRLRIYDFKCKIYKYIYTIYTYSIIEKVYKSFKMNTMYYKARFLPYL